MEISVAGGAAGSLKLQASSTFQGVGWDWNELLWEGGILLDRWTDYDVGGGGALTLDSENFSNW